MYNPTKTADNEFNASTRITANLTEIICRQEKDLSNYNREEVQHVIDIIKAEKAQNQQAALEEVNNLVD